MPRLEGYNQQHPIETMRVSAIDYPGIEAYRVTKCRSYTHSYLKLQRHCNKHLYTLQIPG